MGDLDSMKGIMDGRMSAMEESIAGLKSFHAEIGEQQTSLKQELREELVQELATPTRSYSTSAHSASVCAIRCYCWYGSGRRNGRRGFYGH